MARRFSTGLRNGLLGGATDGSFKDLMALGFLDLYSGSQPSSADDGETGTLLVGITVASGATGLSFGDAADGVIAKASEVWSGEIDNTGSAGWFRFYDANHTTGASTTAIRFDGSVGTSGAQLNLSSLSLVAGATLTIDTFTVSLAE